MICKQCAAKGLKSKVYQGMTVSTAMYCSPYYYDEEGDYHNHDYNRTTQQYACSNGHEWAEKKPKLCPNCDWTSETKDKGE